MKLDVGLRDRQRLTGRDAQLQVHQVQARDRLRDRVFHLEPRVHLHEVVVAFNVEQELERAGAFIPDRLHCRHGGRAHAFAKLSGDRRRGRFFDQLLVAPLHRTIALPEVDRVAVTVGENLNLDMARLGNRALQDHGGVAERVLRFRLCAAQRVGKVGGGVHEPHAAPTTARRGLDHHRVADARGFVGQARLALLGTLVAGNARHAGVDHQPLRAGLVAHRQNRLGRRADEDETGVNAGLRELGVLGQKSVARVHRVGTRLARGVDDARNVQVRLRRQRLPDAHRLVGLDHMARVGVGGRVHGHCAVAMGTRAAHHTQRDLAAVCDEDLVEGRLCCGHAGDVSGVALLGRWSKPGHFTRLATSLRQARPAGTRARRHGAWAGGPGCVLRPTLAGYPPWQGCVHASTPP